MVFSISAQHNVNNRTFSLILSFSLSWLWDLCSIPQTPWVLGLCLVCIDWSSVPYQGQYFQPREVLLLCRSSRQIRCSPDCQPHKVSTRQVALQIPPGTPHWATHPEPFPEVSSFYVSHIGYQRETLHLDGKDVLPTSSEPQSAQGRLFLIQGIFPWSSASKHEDPLDERGYFWSLQTGCKSSWNPPPDLCMLSWPFPDQDDFVHAIRQCPQPCPFPNVTPCSAPLGLLQLSILPQPLTSAVIIPNTGTKLNITVLLVPGFRKTSWPTASSCSSCWRF